MLRIFLPLYLILIVFIIGFVIALDYLPNTVLADMINKHETRITQGTFYLVDKKLKGLNLTEQKKVLSDLQDHFGYPLQLLAPNNPLIDEKSWLSINEGNPLYLVIDNADYNIAKLKESESVLAIAFSESQKDNDHRQAQGTFYLLKQTLANSPQSNWPDIIESLKPHFGFPLNLINDIDIKLDSTQKQQLANGVIISLDRDTNEWRFYGKLENSPYTLKLGPIQQPISNFSLSIALLVIFILSLATALFLWIRPLWRSVKNISQTADDFGQGNLHSRTQIKEKSSLGRLAKQFNTMADRISSLVIGHRELTNAVSHELRTPIARMRFALDMLENSEEASRARYLTSLNTDVEELEDLVNELLRYARFEHLNTADNLETIEVIPWLSDILEQASAYIGDKTLIHTFNDLPADLTTKLNSRHFSRAIHNLLRNASFYGGHSISLSLSLENQQLSIRIEDDGIGISEEDRERVFEAFTRLDASRHHETGGHGLGLAITKRIVEAHQGTITISDSPLGGACFTLSWPL